MCDLLSRSALRPLTLLSAPAGWGKTSLLSEWIDSGSRPGHGSVAGAGGGGRRPSAVLEGRHGGAARRPAGARASGAPAAAGLDGFITSLMNALEECADPVVLVLDDFQEAASAELVADLDALAEHAPPSLRVVLSTRVDPPLRLERLRLAGRLAEVRAADLALTGDEARALWPRRGVELDDRELDVLLERTEGWPAGVRLAALSLEGTADAAAFVEQLRGRRPGRQRLPRERGDLAPAAGEARVPAAHVPGRAGERGARRRAHRAAATAGRRSPSSRPITGWSIRSTRAATGIAIRPCCVRCCAWSRSS